ncbi:hypothetical protein IEU95_05120 [Hoyosella rhizosphaerae]|nr:hypothetical protein [Hoyosella rhizosphaerae]
MPDNLGDLDDKIASLPSSQRDEINEDLHRRHEHRPELAMVGSVRRTDGAERGDNRPGACRYA